jgi:hypothetical protein
VLAAEVSLTECAITNDSLGSLPALLGAAANLLASHDVWLRPSVSLESIESVELWKRGRRSLGRESKLNELGGSAAVKVSFVVGEKSTGCDSVWVGE